MSTFPYWSALGGGLLIGLAAALMLLGNGRVAGISGLTAEGAGLQPSSSRGGALAFLAGLLLAAAALAAVGRWPAVEVSANWPLLVISGLLVGFGTRLGSGCTSGHGVCGMSRLSPRSLLATCLFMAAAALTVWVIRHGLGLTV